MKRALGMISASVVAAGLVAGPAPVAAAESLELVVGSVTIDEVWGIGVPNDTVDVEIFDSVGGSTIHTGQVTTDETGWYLYQPGVDLGPGQQVVASQDGVTRDVVLQELSVDDYDADENTVSGTAAPNVYVEVHVNSETTQSPNIGTTSDGQGNWTVDFDDVAYDALPEENPSAFRFEADGDHTHAEYQAPEPLLCAGFEPTIIGTEGRDFIFGTPGPDVIMGLGGNDVIFGLNGDDVICGGEGRDVIRAGRGNDGVFGELGRDRLYGGPGEDFAAGGEGRDVCRNFENSVECERP